MSSQKTDLCLSRNILIPSSSLKFSIFGGEWPLCMVPDCGTVAVHGATAGYVTVAGQGGAAAGF